MVKILSLIFMFNVVLCFSQSDLVASGGNATGSGGSSSYSVGQVAYLSLSGTNGALTQGVQQPIEIYTLSVGSFEDSVQAVLYPNPAINSVVLSFNDSKDVSNMSYELIDVTGKLIRNGKVSSNQTEVDVADLATATYFFNVLDSNKRVKSFKLVKNK